MIDWVDLRALSLSQPWCWATMDPIARKHIDNRSWQPPIEMIGKTIAIHAAKSWDKEPVYRGTNGYLMTPISYLHHLGIEPPMSWAAYASAAIVGVATIDRIVSRPDTLADDQKRWYFGPRGWVLTDVRPIARPIACKGKQGLWRVSTPLIPQIAEQLQEAA